MTDSPAAVTDGPFHVGCDAERAAIAAVLEAAVSGSGSVLLFCGEAGIGKSQLVGLLASDAGARRIKVLSGAARTQTVELAFAPAIEAFGLREPAVDDRGQIIEMLVHPDIDSPTAGGLRARIVEAITDHVEHLAQQEQVVVSIEDLHWADASTLLLLERLADLTSTQACILACSARPTPRPEVNRALEALAERGHRFDLEGLGPEEVAQLVQARYGVPAGPALLEMLGRAGGNPFFILELLDAAAAERTLVVGKTVDVTALRLPPSLALTVLGSLRGLPEPMVRILRAAAVLGSTFAVEELRAMTGAGGVELMEALDPALRAGILNQQGDELGFRHDLVREALYQDTPAPVRMALHADAASSLEAQGAHPAVVAAHVRGSAAPGDEIAIGRLRRAAEAAADRAPPVAAELLEHALELAGKTSPQRYDLRVMLARTLTAAGSLEEAGRLAREALAERRGGSQERDLLLTLARAMWLRGWSEEILDRLEEAARDPEATPVERALLMAEAAAGSSETRDYERGHALAEAAWDLAGIADDDTARCRVLLTQASLHKARLSMAPAVSLQRRALDLLRSGGVTEDTAVWVFLSLGDNLGQLDEHRAEGVALLNAGLRRAEEAGMTWTAPLFHFIVGAIRYREGAWEDAIADLETATRLGESAGVGVASQSAALLGVIQARRGEGRAAQWIARAEELAGRFPEGIRGEPTLELILARAFHHEANGELREALGTLMASLNSARGAVRARWGLVYGLHVARLTEPLERHHAMQAVLHMVSAASRESESPTAVGIAQLLEAVVERDPDEALAGLEKIRGEALVASTIADAGERTASLLATAGRTSEAIPLLEEALVAWERAGASRQVRRLEAKLRDLGVRRGSRTRARASTGWQAISPAEQAVLDLVMEGLLYREVADRLFISKRTVETHITHLFQKLGVANRRELEALARARPARRPPTAPASGRASR